MPVQDHPQFDEWCNALDELKEAKDRFRIAKQNHDKALPSFAFDLEKAQKKYDEISAELE
jgi:hypothetical protein